MPLGELRSSHGPRLVLTREPRVEIGSSLAVRVATAMMGINSAGCVDAPRSHANVHRRGAEDAENSQYQEFTAKALSTQRWVLGGSGALAAIRCRSRPGDGPARHRSRASDYPEKGSRLTTPSHESGVGGPPSGRCEYRIAAKAPLPHPSNLCGTLRLCGEQLIFGFSATSAPLQ